MSIGTIFIIVIVAVIVMMLAANIRIVPQSEAYVIERLGAYKTTWGTGIHVKIPFVESIARKVSQKEKVLDFPPQAVITKDNVTIQIDTVIFYTIMDPKQYAYGAENPLLAIENLTATTLRNLIGELSLDETLTSRDTINTKLRSILDDATDAWGVKVNRVELKDIVPPKQIQDSMEKQMKAERDRREKILQAEGEKTSSITIAEGKKASAILEAEGQLESTKLLAEASKQKAILEAQGEAEALLAMNEAQAKAIDLINKAEPTMGYLQIKALEALEKVADGNATKIIVPSGIQDLSGLLASLKEVGSDVKPEVKALPIAESSKSDDAA